MSGGYQEPSDFDRRSGREPDSQEPIGQYRCAERKHAAAYGRTGEVSLGAGLRHVKELGAGRTMTRDGRANRPQGKASSTEVGSYRDHLGAARADVPELLQAWVDDLVSG